MQGNDKLSIHALDTKTVAPEDFEVSPRLLF